MADEANVPPYVIFSDKTLIEMAAFFPQTQRSLMELHGVGEVKFARYGRNFLNIISSYCDTHQIEERPKRKSKAAPYDSGSTRKRRHIVVGEAYNACKSVDKVMAEFSIKQTTILDHLFKYIQEGHALKPEKLLCVSAIPSSQQSLVLKNFARLGPEYLLPVFEALNGEVSYDELKILRLYYLSRT